MHMLIADDNTAIIDILRAFAEREGWQVTAASDGEAALAAARDGAFDVVLLDVMMPKMDGFAVCHALRTH